MKRFALPRGRWRYCVVGALLFISAWSRLVASPAQRAFDEMGVLVTRADLVASPLWILGSAAIAFVGVSVALVSSRLQKAALTMTCVALLAASATTIWATLAIACQPVGLVCCMRPISR
ncbi:MAG: hypothetical protein QM723_01085 [Myxococcaceae bacterium]